LSSVNIRKKEALDFAHTLMSRKRKPGISQALESIISLVTGTRIKDETKKYLNERLFSIK
jgi:hypothetical protein